MFITDDDLTIKSNLNMKKEVLVVLENDGIEKALEKFGESNYAEHAYAYKRLYLKILCDSDYDFNKSRESLLNACSAKDMDSSEIQKVKEAFLDNYIHQKILKKYPRDGMYETENRDCNFKIVWEKVPVDCAWIAKQDLRELEDEICWLKHSIKQKKEIQVKYLRQCLDMVGKETDQ